jgi:hypothetical protein
MSKTTKKSKKFTKKNVKEKKQLSEQPRKQNKRNSFQYPALEPSVNLKTRQEAIEDVKSYFHKLSPEEKKWMNAFMEEENNANFNHSGPKLNKTRDEKKKIYNRNNARNRCIFTREKAQDKLSYVERAEDLEKKVE